MFEIALISCLLIAFGVGSNDASNALSVSIGAGVLKLKRALILFGIFVFLGIFIQGQKVMNTVGKGITDVNSSIVLVALTVSAILIIVSNWRRLPLSSHQVIIGSLTGAASASGTNINFPSLFYVLLSWIISPFIALGLAYLIYKLLEMTLSRYAFFQIEKILRSFLILSSILISYNTGANELATVLGPVIHSGAEINKLFLFLLSSSMVFLGAILLSYRVIETVGKGITTLDPYSGFAAQMGAGGCVLLFTFLGMPVSTTYCLVGAISGVGFTKGIRTVKMKLIIKIITNFFLSPSLAFVLSYALLKVIKFLLMK